MQGPHFLARVKEVSIQIALIGAGVALCSAAKAQNRQVYHSYQGQKPGFTRPVKRKDDYAECRNQYLKRGIPAEVYAACVDGIKDAEDAARFEATAQGCENGYFTGFSAGLYDGSQDFRSDSGSFQEGLNAGKQRAMSLVEQDRNRGNTLMRSAISAGQSKGLNDGDGDARTAWVNALDRGIPKSNPHPATDLNFTNSEYQAPYGQLVAQPLSLDQMATDLQYDVNTFALYRNQNRRSRICNPQTFVSSRNSVRGGSYYRKDGRYVTDRSSAIDGNAAFERWMKGSTNFNARDARSSQNASSGSVRAKALQGRKIEVADEAPAAGRAQTPPVTDKPADQPATRGDTRGANNGGRSGAGNAPAQQPAPPAKPADQPAAQAAKPAATYDLWQIYSSNFRGAYSYYADDYYNDGFYDLLDEGSNDGYGFGITVGQEFSRQNGRVAGFDREFRNQESVSYNGAYQNRYFSAYDETFRRYQTTPVVRAQLLDVVETVKDGIFQPGEPIKAIYVIKNYGGVPANVTAQLQGAGIESSNAAPAVVAPVSSKQVADGVLTATINSKLTSLSTAQILLVVSGGEEVQQSPIEKQVTHQVTLDHVTYEAVVPAGVIKVTVSVRNQSPLIPTSEDVRLVITDSSGNKVEPNLGTLDKGQALTPPAFEIKGVDPLSLYLDQAAFKVELFKGKQSLGTTDFIAVRHNEATEMQDLAQIFDDAAQDPAKAAQAAAAQKQLVDEVSEEIKDVKNSRYESKPEGTLLFEVVKVYRKRGAQSASAKQRYREFTNEIRPLSKKLTFNRLFGRKSPGEKAFLGYLDELSK